MRRTTQASMTCISSWRRKSREIHLHQAYCRDGFRDRLRYLKRQHSRSKEGDLEEGQHQEGRSDIATLVTVGLGTMS